MRTLYSGILGAMAAIDSMATQMMVPAIDLIQTRHRPSGHGRMVRSTTAAGGRSHGYNVPLNVPGGVRPGNSYRATRRSLWRQTTLPWSSFKGHNAVYDPWHRDIVNALRPGRVLDHAPVTVADKPTFEERVQQIIAERAAIREAALLSAMSGSVTNTVDPMAEEVSADGGVVDMLPPGDGLATYADFSDRLLRKVAASFGTSYEEMSKPSPVGEMVKDEVVAALQNEIGTEVIWTSSGVRKMGKITHVVPAGSLPADVGAKIKDPGAPCDHVSYVVSAIREDQDLSTAKPVNYWLRVSLLSLT